MSGLAGVGHTQYVCPRAKCFGCGTVGHKSYICLSSRTTSKPLKSALKPVGQRFLMPKSAGPRHIRASKPASHTPPLMSLNLKPQTNPRPQMRIFPALSVNPWRHTQPPKTIPEKQKELKNMFKQLETSMSNSKRFAKRNQTSKENLRET